MGVRGNKGKWTYEEHEAFLHGLDVYGRNWEGVAAVVPTRTVLQIRTHSQKYFAKIDRGGVFPDLPYPSQYDTASGKSSAAAGTHVYGLSQQTPPQQEMDVHGSAMPNIMPVGQGFAFPGGGGYSSGFSFTPTIDGHGLYGAAVPPLRFASGMSSAAHYAAPGPVINSVAGFPGGRGQQGWGGQHQQHGFGVAPIMDTSPVPGHTLSFDEWIDAPLPVGDGGVEEKDVVDELVVL